MKLRHRIKLLWLTGLFSLSISLVLLGAMVIEDILYQLNMRILALEMQQVKSQLDDLRPHGMISGLTTDPANPTWVVGAAEALHNVSLDRTGRLLVIDTQTGAVLYKEPGAGEIHPDTVAQMIQKRQGFVEYGEREPDRFCAFDLFAGGRCMIGLTVAKREMLYAQMAYLRIVSVVSLVVLLCSVMLTVLFSSGLTTRIAETLAAVRRAEAGDYNVRIGPRMARDELGELQRGINAMVARIEQRTADLLASQTALEERSARLRAVFEAATDVAFITADLEAVGAPIQEFSAGAERTFGFRREEIIGRPLSMLKLPITTNGLPDAQKIRGRVHGVRDEAILQRKSGERFPALFTTYPIKDGDGHTIAILAVAVDITDQKRAEEERRALEAQVQHAQKLESLGVLAGGIAHDFNNLLVGILGHASLALRDLAPGAPARNSVEQVEIAARRAADLTNQMLAYSGKGRFLVAPLNLSSLVREMTDLMQAAISKKAELRSRYAADLPFIEADATQVRQVVLNLITNASDALNGESGRITIETGVMVADREYLASSYTPENLPPGDYVYIEVADTGIGMDAATKAKIFDPFFTTKFTGRGLGLAAVIGIVRGHRGMIRVDSTPGEGTTFRVLFPASQTHLQNGAAPAAIEALDDDWRGTGTVLIVDDEETVLEVVGKMLENVGFQTVTAADGHQGIEVFRQHADDIDLVILDMTMPRMSGEETFHAIREIRPSARVLLSSGFSEQEATRRFQRGDLAGFIQKPYLAKDLIGKVREALGH